jgi:hypothetical protein
LVEKESSPVDSPENVLTLERAVNHEHDHVQKLLVTGALTDQTGKHDLSNRYVWPLPSEPANFLPGGTPSAKKHLGLI